VKREGQGILGPILAAEDNPDDLFLLERAFEKADLGKQLRIARDGQEASDYLEGNGRYGDRDQFPLPLLLLLDLKMPRRSGFEVLAWMRGRPETARIPVIILTASSDEQDVRRAYELGATSYHVKPGSFGGLLALVRELGQVRLSAERGAVDPGVPLPGAQPRPT
jgi:CheY-like chemotaxis protein